MNHTAYHSILERLGVRPSSAYPANPVEVSRLLAMPLTVFAVQGLPLEVRVPWWSETLWFVPSERDFKALSRDGVARYRVWTAAELISVLSVAQLSLGDLHVLMVVRREFGGEVLTVRWKDSR